MTSSSIVISLNSLFCYHGGDEDGDSEPYLWTIMYKIDGSCITQNGTALKGSPQYFTSPGSHGNLGSSVSTDGTLPIPANVGRWATTLEPIVITNPLTGSVIEVPGTIGVVAVLMEENSTPNGDMEAGHQALNKFVQQQLQAFVDSINLAGVAAETQQVIVNQGLSERDALIAVLKQHEQPFADNLQNLTKAVVFYAVANELGFGGAILSGIDRDDYQGAYFRSFTQTELDQTSANPAQSGMQRIDILELIADPDEPLGASYAYNLHGQAWRQVNVTWTPATQNVPPGRWQVTGIHLASSHYVGRWIQYVGGTFANGDPWILERGHAADLINNGTHSFFVIGADGAQSEVIASDALNLGHLYLTTVADGSKADNLLSLPPCAMAVRHEENVG
jgi:hypothetical protein